MGKKTKTDVAIVMGSASDESTMLEARKACETLGMTSETIIMSAHRDPERVSEFGRSAHTRYNVIIAGAGLAAHLPGVLASLTLLPVIGVPIASGALNGIDALYSIVQMPKGVPVATVGIGNAFNAGVLAARLLALNSPEIAEKLQRYQILIRDENRAASKK